MPERRTLLKGIGGTAALTSLSGCALFNQNEEEGPTQNQVSDDIPEEPVKIAFAELQSGAGSIHGHMAIDTAQLLVDRINENGGILGQREIDATYIDSSTGSDEMVNEVRSLATEEDIDLLTGFTSSATALAVAPVAEDLGLPTIFQNTGTTELFQDEGEDYEYVYRVGGNLLIDSVGAARLVSERLPDVETVATIHEDYVYGQNMTDTFSSAIEQLEPDIEIVAQRFTDFQAQDYTSHISALSDADPDFIFSSHWGGGGMSLIRQADSQGLFENTEMAFGAGEHILQAMGGNMPEGIWFSGRGANYWGFQYGVNPVRTEFVDSFVDEYGEYPHQAAFHQWYAVNWYIRAVERYNMITGGYPDADQLSGAMLGTSMQSPSGFTAAPSRQAKPTGYFGRTTHTDDHDFALLTDEFVIAPELVNPPDSVSSSDWIQSLGSE